MDSRVMTHAELEQVLSDSTKTSLGVTWMMDYIALLQDEVERVKEQRDTYRDQLVDSRDEHLVTSRALSGIRRIADDLGIAFEDSLRERAHLVDAVARVRGAIALGRDEVKCKTERILELEEQVRRLSASRTGIGSSAGGGSPSST